MANNPSSGSLVQKLILLVLTLILGCLGAIFLKLHEAPPGAEPPEPALAAVEPVAEPDPVPPPVASPLPVRPVLPPRTDKPIGVAQPLLIRPVVQSPRPPVPPVELLPVQPVMLEPVPVAPPPAVQPGTAVLAGPTSIWYGSQPTGNDMRLNSDSSIHKWYAVSKIISGYFEVEPAWQTDPSLKTVSCLGTNAIPPGCRITIPVRTLKSSSGTKMDSVMMEALEARQFKNIEYKLTFMALSRPVPESGGPVLFDTVGELKVHGVTRLAAFPIRMDRIGTNVLKFTGTLAMKMSDFGVQPPVLTIPGAGRIVTADDIVLTWTWTPVLATGPLAGR